MKIFIAQQHYHIGNFSSNTAKIIAAIETAKAQGGDLIVFSEMSICGYPARDFVEFNDFINQCYASLDAIMQHADTIGVIVGGPARNPNTKGKSLYNAAFFLYEKAIQHITYKTLLPTYDIFDEYRYFEPAQEWDVVSFKGKKLAVTICEDIWNIGKEQLYRESPLEKLVLQSPDIIINISASPFDYTHDADRKAVLKANVEQYQLPIIYCNTVGTQTEIVFDGGSIAIDKAGNIVKMLPQFTEALDSVTFNEGGRFVEPTAIAANDLPNEPLNPSSLQETLNIDEVYAALVMGIRDYFEKMGFIHAILGSSGGIDSAVVQALATAALGAEKVTALLLPSPYSSEHSVLDAVALSNNLGNHHHIIHIKNVYETMLETVNPLFEGLPFGLAEENMQSRIRGNILMAVANKHNYILLNTSNKSELSTGYGTLYGDMAGGIGVLGDCYKLQVYALAQYINRNKEWIPSNILTKAPSAELRPNQKDSDSLPDYSLLDQLLYQYIECRKGPAEIKAMGFDANLTDRVLKMVNTNEYKRNQFCPIIRVSPKAFGVGRRMPIVGKYLL